MNRNRLIVGLAVAIVLAFLVSSFVYQKFKQASVGPPAVAMKHIVVAAAPLQLGTRLDPTKLRLISWPGNEPMAGMFTRLEDCTNRALITPVAENEPILESKLPFRTNPELDCRATIQKECELLSIAVNDVVAVAGFVMPGTMVDVLVTGQTAGGANITKDNLRKCLSSCSRPKRSSKTDDEETRVDGFLSLSLLVTPGRRFKADDGASAQEKFNLHFGTPSTPRTCLLLLCFRLPFVAVEHRQLR